MNLKKLFSLSLAIVLVVSLAACGSGASSSSAAAPAASKAESTASKAESPAASKAESTDAKDVKIGLLIPGSPTDGGFSQQGAEAGKYLEEQLGCTVSLVQVSGAAPSKAEAETMASNGYKIIFGHGGEYSSPFAEICEEYPDTWFVTLGGSEVRDNQFPVVMSVEEGFYVMGVIAGMMTETNTIGWSLGGDYPAYTKTVNAWALGAKSVNPDIEVLGSVLSAPNANEGYETTVGQITSGADFIVSNSNEAQSGALKAVSENEQVYGFGGMGDFSALAPEQVICSAVGDFKPGYVDAAKSILDGTAKPEVFFLTIENGCVSLVWNEAVKATLPPEVIEAADKTYEDVKNGTIHVPNEYEQEEVLALLEA